MPGNNNFLITRPRHEELTDLLFYWSQEVVDEAKHRRFNVLDLSGEKANKKTFASYVRKHRPDLIFFNGHGSAHAITGHNNEVLVEVNSGDDLLLAGSIVYARSCDAAQNLGVVLVKKGTKAFLGYRRKFTVAYSDIRPSRILADKLARLFLEPSNLAPICLLKGNTVGEADTRSKAAMYRNFSYMLSSAASWEEQSVASYLWGNIKAQTVIGDLSATI